MNRVLPSFYYASIEVEHGGSALGYRFHFNVDNELPKLAWIARIRRKSHTIEVIHGASVECRDDFMVEGVWDDDFEKGNFHRKENFFGSGIKIEDNKVYFSITSSSIDRLLYCEDKGTYIVSNSLILLLAFTGAKLDNAHDYKRESLSVCISRNQYSREFAIIHPQIKNLYQVFHENIIFTEEKISFEYRYKKHSLHSYSQCIEFMNDILKKIRKNYESDTRKHIITPFSMLSQGYDSTAVSTLVSQIGVKSVFIANKIRPTIPRFKRDDEVVGARRIAEKLGYEVIFLDNKRSNISEDELFFLATTYPKHHSGAWSEVGLHLMAKYIEANCSAAVVFSGHHGDSVWDANIQKSHLNEIRVPGSPFGFCSEMRLKSGFINIPLPGILAMDIKDIAKISLSPEMEPWRLYNPYDRPIPRRIAEEAGIDRHLFGMEKKFVATKYNIPINIDLRKLFLEYLRVEHHIHPTTICLGYILNLISKLCQSVVLHIGKRQSSNISGNYLLGKDIDLYFFMSIWATSRLSEKIARILSQKTFQ